MFADHQPIIAAHAQSCAAGLREVIRLAILSARQPLYNMPADMEQAHAGGDEAMSVLFGWKLRAWASAETDQDAIYWNCLDLWEHEAPEAVAVSLVAFLASLPGLGLAKAGFVAQMVFGVAGCLDTHNLRRFNLPPRAFANFCQRTTRLGRRRAAERYVATLDRLGTPAALWDSWCHHVATEGRQRRAYKDANHVSALHCIALGLEHPAAS